MPDQRSGDPLPDESNFTESERLLAQLASELRQRAELAERELVNLRGDLADAHAAFVAAERAALAVLRLSSDRVRKNGDHRRLKAAGSCQTCGTKTQAKRSRGLDCGRKNSAGSKRRAARAA